jgi:hypothetical protein
MKCFDVNRLREVVIETGSGATQTVFMLPKARHRDKQQRPALALLSEAPSHLQAI